MPRGLLRPLPLHCSACLAACNTPLANERTYRALIKMRKRA